MLNALRVVRSQPHQLLPLPFPSSFGLKISGVRFGQFKPDIDQQANMDKKQNQDQKPGDVMSHSFGEGYSTRSEEEGFGGIYEGKQTLPNPDEDKVIHENDPAYDKTQGSSVKEKEKGRNQTNASA